MADDPVEPMELKTYQIGFNSYTCPMCGRSKNMEKGTAETFEQRKNEWLKQKRILDAEQPQLPSLRLNPMALVILDEDSQGIWVKRYGYDDDDVEVNSSSIHIDKGAAIDMAHFIFELFGDKYSPD